MKIVEFEITRKELCIIVGEWWVEHHGDTMKVDVESFDVESFDADQLETISFRAVDS